ncbi:hypothetical protein MnTg02_01369 [bacterium MnTg02]|nr:hypothetical protein MnTg02_01369 [bacterium MnTg02]
MERLVLEVKDQTRVARGLYDALGFSIAGHRKVDCRKSPMFGGGDALIIVLSLSKCDAPTVDASVQTA